MKFFVPAILLMLVFSFTNAQTNTKPKLLAGPVIGTVTPTTARIWIAYRGTGNNVLILGDTAEQKVYYPVNYSFINNRKGDIAITMDFTGLQPNHRYNILISIDGWGTHARYSFVTPKDTPVTDFNFLLGSCNLLNTDITRMAFPGGANWIFKYMRKKQPEFMVWLGDNSYYLYKKQHRSYEDMFKRHLKIRTTFRKVYRDFLGNQANYAIWDDHDYGPNDANKTFPLKDTALTIFKGFWPNTYPETEAFKGNYFSFRYYDAEFFMTDDRYHRDPEGDTTGSFLGEDQLIWLKHKLQQSDATFKFVSIGSQLLNDNHFGESYAKYPKERNELLDFIAANNISGVLFLTGDKHYSEISRRDWKGYPMYDITCSPLTAPPLPRWLLGAKNNTHRITGTDYGRRNFGRIEIKGTPGNRTAVVQFYGRSGKKRREYSISQQELIRK